ncbi:conserved protein of unknown function [Magnetospirillum sp. XM-1]|uniref:hypothetical protein n=1 Tax=Magnetospirillum sp. XM-1 TaxID=1663591 RepID=UPI00073DE35E|nr:hypothetical protein [Magnetospirillum sp. XM-1]CUW41125.1 conserved protein of unknown function [Magnetospirillum sp. XM-1]
MNRLAWVAFALAVIGGAAVSGALVHSYDRAQHDKAIADLRADAATTLADQTEIVLRQMQDQIDRYTKLENDYAHLSQDTARAQADSVRLSADLAAAEQRLLQPVRAGGGGGGSAPTQTTAGADRCQDVRAALGRALGAVAVLRAGGDEAAQLGQDAVDVATIAARAAQDAARAPEAAP